MDTDQTPFHLDITIDKFIRTAMNILRNTTSNATEHASSTFMSAYGANSNGSPGNIPAGLKLHSLNVIKATLLAILFPQDTNLMEKNKFKAQLLAVIKKAESFYKEKPIRNLKNAENFSKVVVTDALSGLFYAVVAKDLRSQALPFFNIVVRQLTIQAILESVETSKFYQNQQIETQNFFLFCSLMNDKF